MLDEDGPRRIKHRPDTAPALARALQLLQRGTDDTARLQRVAAGLGPVLDMPLDAASRIVRRSGPSLSVPRSQAVVPRWSACVVGGLAALAPLLWFANSGPSPRSTRLISARAVAPLPALLNVQNVAEAPPAALQYGLGGVQETQARSPESGATNAALSRHRPRTRRVALQRLAAATQLRAFEATPPAAKSLDTVPLAEPVVSADPTTSEPASPPAAVASVQAVPATQAESTGPAHPSRASAAASSSDSESELLLRARQALRSDLARALRLVGEHEARFPKGELVPEREVLAIEVLRALGQSAAADARVQQFRARYPESFYLERLRH
jgi:hypothetical protein